MHALSTSAANWCARSLQVLDPADALQSAVLPGSAAEWWIRTRAGKSGLTMRCHVARAARSERARPARSVTAVMPALRANAP